MSTWLTSYLVRVKRFIVDPIRPVNDIRALFATLKNVLIGSLISGFDFIATKDDSLDRAICVHGIMDFAGDRCNNTKIVACTLYPRPQIGLWIDRFHVAIGKNYVHRSKLIGDQAMVTLEPSMATTKSRS